MVGLYSVAFLLLIKVSDIQTESNCDDIPQSNYTGGTSTDVPVDELLKDLIEFQRNFKDKFEEMKIFIRKNQARVPYLDIKYLLYTPQNPDKSQSLTFTKRSLLNSNFNPEYPVIVLIHGFSFTNDDQGTNFYALIKNSLLKENLLNVIIVDYSKYSGGLYSQAVRASYLVAENIAIFIRFLEKNSYVSAAYYHVIGMSLGGQVSGIVGQNVPGLGRITGLDPAGPLYEKFPTNYRLSYDDAEFVDVIHTGSAPFPEGLGIPLPSGDVDFYVNGGKIQPGCGHHENATSKTQIDSKTMATTLCSHERSLRLYLESICSVDCIFIGVSCDSYEDYQNGFCTTDNSYAAIMGYYAFKRFDFLPGTKFYLNTNSKAPYCEKPNLKK